MFRGAPCGDRSQSFALPGQQLALLARESVQCAVERINMRTGHVAMTQRSLNLGDHTQGPSPP
jgi:hypothetical protein